MAALQPGRASAPPGPRAPLWPEGADRVALVVARKNKGQVETLQDLVANLAETPAVVAGVVFNEF